MAWFSRKNKKSDAEEVKKVTAPVEKTETAGEELTVVAPRVVVGAAGVGALKYFVRPAVTEKGTLVGQHNSYVFLVRREATKPAIKQAIEKLYGVKVVAVRTLRQKAKTVRFGGRPGKRSALKKAYVTVAKGQSITVVKGV